VSGYYPFAAYAAALAPGVPVLTPSGDTTGTADTDHILAAIEALPGTAGLGSPLLGPGTWYWEPDQISLKQGQGLKSLAGSGATFVNCVGTATGPMIGLANSGTFTGGQYAAPVGGFTLLGYSAGSGTTGIAASGLQGQRVSDMYIAGFPGGGVNLTNAAGTYQEQGSWRDIILVQNGTSSGWNVLYSNSSFDYTVFEWTIVALANTDGIRLQDGAQLSGVRLDIRGNFYGGASGNTGAVIAMDRGNAAGTSYIIDSLDHIAVESAGSGTGHTTLLQGSASASSQFAGTGVFSFNPVAVSFQGYSTAGASFSFAGIINDPAIGTTTPGEVGMLVYGETVTNDVYVKGNGNFASGNAALFLDNGNGQVWQFFADKNTGHWGIYDQTNSVTGLGLVPDSVLLQLGGGTSTASSAPVLAPSLANGTAAQLADTTRDYMVYLEVGMAGTALVVKIGPTSTPANTVVSSGVATSGEVISFRLPAGWYAEWSATTATLAGQLAVGC
jgi:hypothetical protein